MVKIRSNAKGFTLLELLVVTGLMFLVVAALTTSMLQGLRMYQRLSAANQEQEVAIFLERFTKDIKNTIPYSIIPFEAESHAIRFASVYNASINENYMDIRIADIQYLWDAEQDVVVRKEIYPANFSQAEQIKEQVVAEGIGDFMFDYGGVDGVIPHRVSIDFNYRAHDGIRDIHKDILIPTGLLPLEST